MTELQLGGKAVSFPAPVGNPGNPQPPVVTALRILAPAYL